MELLQLNNYQVNPDKIKVKINKETLKDRISQAKLQEEKRTTGKDKYIILDPDKGKDFISFQNQMRRFIF